MRMVNDDLAFLMMVKYIQLWSMTMTINNDEVEVLSHGGSPSHHRIQYYIKWFDMVSSH
jgi:hypothetical protein